MIDFKALGSSVVQAVTAGVGVAAVFGYAPPVEKIEAVKVGVEQLMGLGMVVASLVPGLIASVKGVVKKDGAQ